MKILRKGWFLDVGCPGCGALLRAVKSDLVLSQGSWSVRCLECGASIPVDFDGEPPSHPAPAPVAPPPHPASFKPVRSAIVPPQDKCRACYYDDCPHGDDSDCIGCSKENGWLGFRARKA